MPIVTSTITCSVGSMSIFFFLRAASSSLSGEHKRSPEKWIVEALRH